MYHFCSFLDVSNIDRLRALNASLQDTSGGDYELSVLCADEDAASALTELKLPQVRVGTLDQLGRKYPALASAKSDRTPAEFYRTAKPWWMWHLLESLSEGDVLTFVAPEMYFFGSPEHLMKALGDHSIGISPHGFSSEFSALERFGKYNGGLVCLRNDSTGLACVEDWAKRCVEWCFLSCDKKRYAEQKYLNAWVGNYPQVISIDHPGVNAAPWNLTSRRVVRASSGLQIDEHTLVCFQFQGLTHLVDQLYDPGLAEYGLTPSVELRELIYLPYLRKIGEVDGQKDPDIVPPLRTDDKRSHPALVEMLSRVQHSQKARASLEQALESQRLREAEAQREFRAREANTAHYVKELEDDRSAQREELISVKGKLLKAYDDILRDVDTKKELSAEIERLRGDGESRVQSLEVELGKRSELSPRIAAGDVRQALATYGRDVRRMVVLKYHPRLMPEILWLAAMGTQIEVLGSPEEFLNGPQGPVYFRREEAWEWLAQIDSLFHEQAYFDANPDVAQAHADGAILSGWDHYVRYGQREFRQTGTKGYSSGLAEFDAVAFDASDASILVSLLASRLQPQNRLFVSGFVSPLDWFPADVAKRYILGDTVICDHPPTSWLGPRTPSNGLPQPEVLPEQLYPESPAQKAEWPKISVVTVVHNQVTHLEETLRSVLDQNYPKIEYVVIDCGSTDGSLDIIRRYASQLVVLELEAGETPTRALNAGIKQSSGLLFSWLNVGDRLAPGSLYSVGQISLLHSMDLIVGRCARVNEESGTHVIHRTCLPIDRIAALSLDDLLDLDGAWLRDCFFNQPEVFIRRDFCDQVDGLLSEDLGSARDYDFWVSLAKAGAQAYGVPEVLALVRGNPVQTDSDLSELRSVNRAHRQAIAASKHSL